MIKVQLLRPSKLAIALLTFFIISDVQATQYVEKSDEKIVEVNISSVEQNALSIEGGRIDTVIPSVAGALSYVKDTKNGVLYFSLADRFYNGTISLFVTDEGGVRYRILLVPSKIAAEEIMIRPKKTIKAIDESLMAGETSHHAKIKSMIYLMATDHNGDDLAGVEKTSYNKPITLWVESNFILMDVYNADGVRGERYQLTNISQKPLVLQEQEFYRKNVVAVAIENLNLEPQQSTTVYIVRNVD